MCRVLFSVLQHEYNTNTLYIVHCIHVANYEYIYEVKHISLLILLFILNFKKSFLIAFINICDITFIYTSPTLTAIFQNFFTFI